MKKCFIIPHQGFGDLFNSIGIINYYSNDYDLVHVLLLDNSRISIYKEIYFNNKKIIPIIPEFCDYNNTTHPNTCLICMTNGNKLNCPRITIKKCQYINYNLYDGDIIKIGSFDNFNKWIEFKNKDFSFAHAFYSYNNLDTNIRFDYFKLYNNEILENNIYNEFIKKYGSEYILVHEDTKRKLFIDKNRILDNNLPIINLDNISTNFVEYIKVIKNAKEIHLIDSSWSVLIYLLSFKHINIPIFLSETQFKKNGRDTNIYKNPTFNNWNFY